MTATPRLTHRLPPAGSFGRRHGIAIALAFVALALALAAGVIALKRPSAAAGGLDIYLPDLHARVGAPIKATVTTGGATRLRISLQDPSGATRVIADVRCPASPESKVADLDLRNLPPGRYLLTVQALDARGRPLASRRHTFTRRTDSPRVAFDENNALLRDGEPFFPVGVWMPHMEPVAGLSPAHLARAGMMNTAVVQGDRDDGRLDASSFNRLLSECGAWGAAGIGPARGGSHPLAIDSVVSRSRSSRALVSWMWIDEPEYNNISPKQTRAWTEQAHAADPHHPVLMNLVGSQFVGQGGSEASARSFTSDLVLAGEPLPADWISTDYYPVAFAHRFGTDLQTSFDNFAAQLRLAREWTLDLYPTATFIETASQPGLGSDRQPAPEQVWAETWIAVTSGAKGIIWFPHDGSMHPGTWTVMAKATNYLNKFAPILAEPDYTAVARSQTKGARVDVLAKKHDGRIYVFAVNRDVDSPAVAQFGVPQAAKGRVSVFGEGRELESASSFTDSFAPLGVHIYVIDMRGGSGQ